MPAPVRSAIVAVVGVLAVAIGAAAAGFLVSQRGASVGSGAAYVPADAPFFVELRLEPSAAQDAAVREMLGRFPPIEGIDLDQPLYGQLGAWIDEMLLEEGAGVSWTADVAPWFDGHVAMAVTEVPLEALAPVPMDPGGEPPVPPFVVLLGVTDQAAADGAIDRFLAEAGPEAPSFTESEHLGVVIHSFEGAEHGAYAVTDDQLVLASDGDAVRAALDAHEAGTGTLAEMEEITRLTDQLPSDWLAFMTYDLTELMAASFAQAGAETPEFAAAFESLLAHQPLRGAAAISAAGDRVLFDTATDSPTGPFAVENADRGLSDRVPADALYYSESGNIGRALAAVIGPIKEAAAEIPGAAEQLETAESALGADLEELVSWIGDGAAVIGYDGSQPYGGFVTVPTDAQAAERRLAQLASFASLAALDPQSGLSVDEEEVAEVLVTTIRWEDPRGGPTEVFSMPVGVVIEFAVTEEHVLIGFGDAFVRRSLELDPADSLGAQPRFTGAVAEVGGAASASIMWIDLAGAREAIEGAAAQWLGTGSDGESYEADVRPWLLPLDRIVSVGRLDGEVLLQRMALIIE